MPWNAGTYTRPNTTVSPAVGNTTIDAADQNTYTADVATGINACLVKDGTNAATANLNMGSNKLTALADATAAQDATTLSQVQTLVAENKGIFVNNADGGPYIDNTTFSVTSTVTENTFESVGPSSAVAWGGAADHDWTALDSVPQGVDWIEISCYLSASATSTTVLARIYARADGGSATTGVGTTLISMVNVTDGDTDAKTVSNMSRGIKIPVNGNVQFDIYWDRLLIETSTNFINLTGYGWN